jgi:hypothetical protein
VVSVGTKRYRYICKHCKSTNIVWDAWASWDEETQEEVLHNCYDYCWCNDCEQETNSVEIEI